MLANNFGLCGHSQHGASIRRQCPVSCGVCTLSASGYQGNCAEPTSAGSPGNFGWGRGGRECGWRNGQTRCTCPLLASMGACANANMGQRIISICPVSCGACSTGGAASPPSVAASPPAVSPPPPVIRPSPPAAPPRRLSPPPRAPPPPQAPPPRRLSPPPQAPSPPAAPLQPCTLGQLRCPRQIAAAVPAGLAGERHCRSTSLTLAITAGRWGARHAEPHPALRAVGMSTRSWRGGGRRRRRRRLPRHGPLLAHGRRRHRRRHHPSGAHPPGRLRLPARAAGGATRSAIRIAAAGDVPAAAAARAHARMPPRRARSSTIPSPLMTRTRERARAVPSSRRGTAPRSCRPMRSTNSEEEGECGQYMYMDNDRVLLFVWERGREGEDCEQQWTVDLWRWYIYDVTVLWWMLQISEAVKRVRVV